MQDDPYYTTFPAVDATFTHIAKKTGGVARRLAYTCMSPSPSGPRGKPAAAAAAAGV